MLFHVDFGLVFWFLLWTGLIVAWLAAVALSLRWLWHQRVKPLGAALSQAGEAFERLEHGQFAGSTPAPVAVDATPQQRAQIRGALGSRRAARRARWHAAHQATWDRWAELSGRRI